MQKLVKQLVRRERHFEHYPPSIRVIVALNAPNPILRRRTGEEEMAEEEGREGEGNGRRGGASRDQG